MPLGHVLKSVWSATVAVFKRGIVALWLLGVLVSVIMLVRTGDLSDLGLLLVLLILGFLGVVTDSVGSSSGTVCQCETCEKPHLDGTAIEREDGTYYCRACGDSLRDQQTAGDLYQSGENKR